MPLSVCLLVIPATQQLSAASDEAQPAGHVFSQAELDYITWEDAGPFREAVWAQEQALLVRWLYEHPGVPPLLVRIGGCESVHDQYLYRDHGPSSSASGRYGFLDSTWRSWRGPDGAPYARAMDAPAWVQDRAAMALFAKSGTGPWKASASCWRRR